MARKNCLHNQQCVHPCQAPLGEAGVRSLPVRQCCPADLVVAGVFCICSVEDSHPDRMCLWNTSWAWCLRTDPFL